MKITSCDLADKIHRTLQKLSTCLCASEDQSELVKLEMSGERVEMTEEIARLGRLCREPDFGRLERELRILRELGACE